jgi:hypothetical protein
MQEVTAAPTWSWQRSETQINSSDELWQDPVVSYPTPADSVLTVFFEELKGRSTVRRGKRPRHLPDSWCVGWLDPQGGRPRYGPLLVRIGIGLVDAPDGNFERGL